MAEKILVPLTSMAGPAATTNQLKYWAKLAGIKPVTHNRQAHITAQEAGILREVVRLVGEGKTPSAAVQSIYLPAEPLVTVPTPQGLLRLESLERAVLTMADTMQLLVEENRFLRGEVANLGKQVSDLKVALLPSPADPPRQVEAWKPEVRPDPAEEMPWWRVAWLSLVAPEQLRRYDF